MADKTWKACERKLAALFGTIRIPPAVFAQRADRGDDAPDFETDRVAFQSKHGYQFPGYLLGWLEGIKRNAPTGKVGAVIWHKRGMRFDDSLVILRAADLAQLLQASASTPAPTSCDPPGIPSDT
jgi:hypothetical protein